MADAAKQHFVLVDNDKTIQAVILVRGGEFYCFERFDDSPASLEEALKEYSDCSLQPVKLSIPVVLDTTTKAMAGAKAGASVKR
jgi:hypothetical protein